MSGSTTTQTTIINRGLQLLGYKAISSINDNDRGARAMLRAYQPVLEDMLRENFWAFAMKRIILAAASTQPIFGKSNYFPLPGDFIMLGPPDQYTSYNMGALPVGMVPSTPTSGPVYTDWQIESFPGGGQAIASNMSGPLNVRYVSNAITEGNFDPCFSEMLSARLAEETCEEITQSNAKITRAEDAYDKAMKQAKRRNAFEQMPVQPPIDTWILNRL